MFLNYWNTLEDFENPVSKKTEVLLLSGNFIFSNLNSNLGEIVKSLEKMAEESEND
jgi:hypothetical protein